ncbi:EAL domain-containing protein [Vibrio sp. FNV 38]|nr:EAL domain-containing protein [Vibrio sp. FNV 38]
MSLNKNLTVELKSFLVILLIPLAVILPSALYLGLTQVDAVLEQYSSSFIRRVDSVIDEIYFEHQQAISSSLTCDGVRDELFFDSTFREMLLVQNAAVVCSSRLGDVHEDFSEVFGHGVVSGEYLHNPAGDPSKRTIVVATTYPDDKFSGIFSVVDRDYLYRNIGQGVSERIHQLKFRLGSQTYPEFDDFSSDLINVEGRSAKYSYEVIIEAQPQFVRHTIVHNMLLGIVLSFVLSGSFLLCHRYFFTRDSLLEDLKRGLDRDELFLMYQPVVKSGNKHISAIEALARWEHPNMGLIGPDVFIPLAEQHGLINRLTDFVVDRVYDDLFGLEKIKVDYVSINVPPQYLHDENHIDKLKVAHEKLEELGMLLCVEITERQLLDDSALHSLQLLRHFGIKISIDDFGTGHTALSVLQKTHFDVLKIDKCFVDTIGINSVNTPVLQTIIELGHRLGVEIVAEGVETLEQAKALDKAHVQCLQGFYFYKPLNLIELRKLF